MPSDSPFSFTINSSSDESCDSWVDVPPLVIIDKPNDNLEHINAASLQKALNEISKKKLELTPYQKEIIDAFETIEKVDLKPNVVGVSDEFAKPKTVCYNYNAPEKGTEASYNEWAADWGVSNLDNETIKEVLKNGFIDKVSEIKKDPPKRKPTDPFKMFELLDF